MMTEPEIHTWWPYLSIDSKNAIERILHRPDALLPASVCGEITERTGVVFPVRALTSTERDFIRTQQEMVD